MRGEGKYIIRGRPGSGKSTAINIIKQQLEKKGIIVGGIKTPEFREGRIRRGFFVENILTGERVLFASTNFKEGPRVSKYSVKVKEFEKVAIPALSRAMEKCDVVIVDEIGKMELFSKPFTDIIRQIWLSDIVAIGTAPVSRIPFVEEICNRSKVYWIDKGKAGYVAASIMEEVFSLLDNL